jgi:hypothetical protein
VEGGRGVEAAGVWRCQGWKGAGVVNLPGAVDSPAHPLPRLGSLPTGGSGNGGFG